MTVSPAPLPAPSSGGLPLTALCPRPRLVSLDVFRGLTIAAMILVNNPGMWDAVYPPLRHADWNGWTPTDLVFPFFLFVVGVSLVFSLTSRTAQGATRTDLLVHCLWRSLALIAIGLLLNGIFYLPWHEARLPGVLQRIGVVYFFATLITLTTSRRIRGTITVALLVGYWALMTQAAGHSGGDLSPAGNLASVIDRRLMLGHLWRADWDPEGVLSTFPAIATALLGTFAADWMCSQRARSRIAAGLFGAGLLIMAAGQWWGCVFPINKNLWTSSFALFTAGLAAALLAACYWAIEVKGWQGWGQPFVCLGMNPLVIYVASEFTSLLLNGWTLSDGLGVQDWIVGRMFDLLGGWARASLLWAVCCVVWWGAVARLLYRKAIFIKL